MIAGVPRGAGKMASAGQQILVMIGFSQRAVAAVIMLRWRTSSMNRIAMLTTLKATPVAKAGV